MNKARTIEFGSHRDQDRSLKKYGLPLCTEKLKARCFEQGYISINRNLYLQKPIHSKVTHTACSL